jgi:hypothetical protein
MNLRQELFQIQVEKIMDLVLTKNEQRTQASKARRTKLRRDLPVCVVLSGFLQGMSCAVMAHASLS